jgi:Cytochrome c7 and related cytochrome c
LVLLIFGVLLRKILLGIMLFSLASNLCLGQKPPVYKGREEKLPVRVPSQPVGFSHKRHLELGMACLDCHGDAGEKEQAGLPNAQQCMVCHATIKANSPEIKKLAEIHRRAEKLKWVRVYRVPDFVFFSHANHLKAGEKCATCHGPVEEREVLDKEVSTSMTTCMNCHAARKVSNDCSLCHQLGH